MWFFAYTYLVLTILRILITICINYTIFYANLSTTSRLCIIYNKKMWLLDLLKISFPLISAFDKIYFFSFVIKIVPSQIEHVILCVSYINITQY